MNSAQPRTDTDSVARGAAGLGTSAFSEHELEVRAIDRVADEVIAITLADPAGAELEPWDPGAHVEVQLPTGVARQYSLCGNRDDHGSWRIAVLLEPESRGGSAWLHEQLAQGDRLIVRGPRNHFPLVPAPAYAFIAGGVGITPMLPMIAQVAASGAPWTLHYGGRHRTAMAFVDELEARGDAVTVCPQDICGLIDLDAALAGAPTGAAIYCCGPEPLIAAVEERCAPLPRGTLHTERFHPRDDASLGEETAFDVELAQSGVTVRVDVGHTIFEAVQAAGVDVPTSCREGTCGTCETVVLEGTPDHRDSYLTDEEREDNATMMICCSRALTPRLVLDL